MQVKTNLDIMRSLIHVMTEQIVVASHFSTTDSINIRVASTEDGWITQQALVSFFKTSGYSVFISQGETMLRRAILDVHDVELNVRYDDMFRVGVFGSKRVRRTIRTGFSYQSINSATNEILASGQLASKKSDTVAVDDIGNLEHPGARSTHAEIPTDNFIDRAVEPFVIIGAAGVLVYLFFHVRS